MLIAAAAATAATTVAAGLVAAASDQLLPIPVQVGIAVPLFGALATMVGWLMRQNDQLRKENRANEDKFFDRVMPALTEAAISQQQASAAMTRSADISERMLSNIEKLIEAWAVETERRRRA